MKRNDFIRNILFGVAAMMLPKELFKNSGIKHGGRLPFGYTLKLRSDGETTRALTEAEAADIKFKYALIKMPPEGKYIDIGRMRKN